MSKSKIEWTEYSWNPIVGCRKVSPGCANCYAEKMARRLKAMGNGAYDYVLDENGRWDNQVFYRSIPNNGEIKFPKKPTVIFVCSMSDLYYELIDKEDIHLVYNVMRNYTQHTFIVCTKRPERIVPVLYGSGYLKKGESFENVWHLTSVENQEWADKRIPQLLRLREYGDWKLGLSVEPLLGPIDLTLCPEYEEGAYLDQIIVGGESGPGARPMHPDWARSMRDQCAEVGVPFFFKQWGGVNKKKAGRELDGVEYNELAWMKKGLNE